MTNLAALLQDAGLPDEVRASLAALIPPPLPSREAVLARLSLPRTFTPALYLQAIAGLEPAPALEDLVASGDVVPVHGYPDRYIVSDAIRLPQLTRWAADRDGAAACARSLLPLMDPGHAVERLDRLQLAFLDDQAEARRALADAFREADERHDIPECSALVQLVAPIIRQFGDAASTALLNELRSRSQSRNLYLAEFYQTAEYYPRAVEGDLRRFVAADEEHGWIFHVHATGGMGKTTLLRRLISHEWVLGPGHVPCAWIDFDYLDVPTVLQHPALLGLAMASQWNEQLEQPVFGAFLTPSFQPLGSLLFRTRADASARGLVSPSVDVGARARYRAGLSNPMRCGFLSGAVPPATLEERTLRLSQTATLLSYWTDRLPDCLASMPADRPVVLVLDTLEDASLHHGQQLLEMLRHLAALRRQAHRLARERGQPPVRLRLVLSGRHQLGEDHVPEFAREFEGQYETHALAGLAPAEARAFVSHLVDGGHAHGDDGRLLDAIVSKSEGLPFNLALFAEWANASPQLDAATVLASEDVSTAMLIERIVKRIDYQPLRWIIRYGVVPRTLTREYLRDVMREPLVEALSGRAETAGMDTPHSAAEQDVWKHEDGFEFDADALWVQRVLPYSADRSWMSPGENADEVVFRSDIRQPMRRLLRAQRVYAQLHERSRDWFRARATTSTEGSSTAAIEWLYHELQLRGVPGRPDVDLLPALHALLDGPALRDAHDLRAVVCRALRDSDFEDFTPAEQAYVQYRLAEAIGAQHDFTYTHPEAVRALQSAFADATAAATLPGFALEWQRATGGTNLSRLLGAFATLEPGDRLRLAVLVADLAGRESRIVADVLKTALAIAVAEASPSVPVAVLRRRLARSLEHSDPEASLEQLVLAAEDYERRGAHAAATEVRCRASELTLSLGRLTRAAAVLEQGSVTRTVEVRLQLARIELAKGNPGEALALLGTDDQAAGHLLPALWQLRAEALSQRIRVRQAIDAWEQAVRLASQQGDGRVLAEIATGQARFYHWRLRTTPQGTPGVVQSLLQRISHAEGATARSAGPAARQSAPAEVDVWQIAYGPPAPERWQLRAFRELPGESPAARVRLLLALSHVVTPLPDRHWAQLIEQARLLPASARVTALQPPVLLGRRPELLPTVVDELAELFRPQPEGEIEAAWFSVWYGEFLGWIGREEDARRVLAQVPAMTATENRQPWNAAAYRERRRVEHRVWAWARERGAQPGPPPPPDPPQLWSDYWIHTPFRVAAVLVENAVRARDAGQEDLVRASLEVAQPQLAQMPIETEFHVTARALQDTHGAPGGATEADAGGLESLVRPPALARSPRPASETRLGGPPFAVVEVQERLGRLSIRADAPPREQIVSAENRTLELLVRAPGIPRRLAGLPLDQIAEDLREAIAASGISPESPRVALSVPLSSLSCAPWELAFHGAHVPFRLPSTWNESDVEAQAELNARTRRREASAPTSGAAVVRVPVLPLLVLPESPFDRESPVVNAYVALRKFFPRRLGESDAPGSRELVHGVYVASSFIEIPGLNEPAIAGLEWTASTLAHELGQRRGSDKPVVVLDVPLPATHSDLRHQLFLRNYFAQALMDSGTVACVIATGLRADTTLGDQHQALARAFLERGLSRVALLDRLATITTAQELSLDAFFTAHPYLPLFPAMSRDDG